MYQYIGRLERPLPCRVRSLGRPRDNKKYIWWCSWGGDRTGELSIYFARVLHPAMVSLSFSCVVDSAHHLKYATILHSKYVIRPGSSCNYVLKISITTHEGLELVQKLLLHHTPSR